jgi:hypothetical protein
MFHEEYANITDWMWLLSYIDERVTLHAEHVRRLEKSGTFKGSLTSEAAKLDEMQLLRRRIEDRAGESAEN